MRHACFALIVAALLAATPAMAQSTAPGAPSAPDQSAHPCAAGSEAPGQKTLSDKLNDCGGVIRPSVGMDAEINRPAPDPHPGDMPVIRPNPNVTPK
jgi:hypothetical protein